MFSLNFVLSLVALFCLLGMTLGDLLTDPFLLLQYCEDEIAGSSPGDEKSDDEDGNAERLVSNGN